LYPVKAPKDFIVCSRPLKGFGEATRSSGEIWDSVPKEISLSIANVRFFRPLGCFYSLTFVKLGLNLSLTSIKLAITKI
jgi:hypothetical protein